MGRPALGKAARGKVASARVTDDEARFLVSKYGSLTAALRTYISKDIEEYKAAEAKDRKKAATVRGVQK